MSQPPRFVLVLVVVLRPRRLGIERFARWQTDASERNRGSFHARTSPEKRPRPKDDDDEDEQEEAFGHGANHTTSANAWAKILALRAVKSALYDVRTAYLRASASSHKLGGILFAF